MGLGNGINDVAVHGGSVWLVTSGQNVILLDARDLRVQGSESLGAIPVALGIAGGSVWIAGQNPTGPGAAVFRLHEATGRVLQTIVLGGRNYPPSLYATNGDGAIWVADYESGSVLRIDPKTGAIVSRIKVGGHPSGIAVGDGRVWVTVS